MQAISPQHHCGVFDGDAAIGREKKRASKPDDEVGYFRMRTNVFADPGQINRHCAEKVGQKPRSRRTVSVACGPCRP